MERLILVPSGEDCPTGIKVKKEVLHELGSKLRDEAERLRGIVENPGTATACDSLEQEAVIHAGLVDENLTNAEKASQAAWLIWYAFDAEAARREDEAFDRQLDRQNVG